MILIVDDDEPVVRLLQRLIPGSVFASSGEGALHQIEAESPSLVLLDLALPDVDGAVLIHEIRKKSTVPIIVLSGRQTVMDKVLALRNGADDFLGKPFDADLLLARIEAVLRRSTRVPVEPVTPTRWQLGPLMVTRSGAATLDGVADFHLTPTEHHLLVALAMRADQCVLRETLTQDVWGATDAAYDHVLDVHVGRLRKKLRGLPGVPKIVTVPRVGFRLCEAQSPNGVELDSGGAVKPHIDNPTCTPRLERLSTQPKKDPSIGG